MMATLDTVHIVAENIEKFSSLFYKILAESKDENLICSPLSVSVLLSMLTYGARGATGELLKAVLHFTDDDTTNKNSYQTLIDFFNAIETVQLKLANRIYVGNDVIIEHDYQQLTETYFRSTIGNVNFHNKEEACAIINCWCEEKTNNRIKNAIRPENIAHDMKMVMVNAIYFKGNWKNKFNALNTTPKAFHIDSTHSKRVPMMRKTGRYKFSIISEINARCIELPYESNSEKNAMSMYVFLPDKADGLKILENKFDEMNIVRLHDQRGFHTDVNLELPKFTIHSTMSLGATLGAMGLSDIFINGANFRGISTTELKVSEVIQKAFIEVNEEGSEAAAVTFTSMCFGSSAPAPPPISFVVDRPFFCAIVAKYTGTKLFCTRVTDPTI